MDLHAILGTLRTPKVLRNCGFLNAFHAFGVCTEEMLQLDDDLAFLLQRYVHVVLGLRIRRGLWLFGWPW